MSEYHDHHTEFRERDRKDRSPVVVSEAEEPGADHEGDESVKGVDLALRRQRTETFQSEIGDWGF